MHRFGVTTEEAAIALGSMFTKAGYTLFGNATEQAYFEMILGREPTIGYFADPDEFQEWDQAFGNRYGFWWLQGCWPYKEKRQHTIDTGSLKRSSIDPLQGFKLPGFCAVCGDNHGPTIGLCKSSQK